MDGRKQGYVYQIISHLVSLLLLFPEEAITKILWELTLIYVHPEVKVSRQDWPPTTPTPGSNDRVGMGDFSPFLHVPPPPGETKPAAPPSHFHYPTQEGKRSSSMSSDINTFSMRLKVSVNYQWINVQSWPIIFTHPPISPASVWLPFYSLLLLTL